MSLRGDKNRYDDGKEIFDDFGEFISKVLEEDRKSIGTILIEHHRFQNDYTNILDAYFKAYLGKDIRFNIEVNNDNY
jgi:hypothetical protein